MNSSLISWIIWGILAAVSIIYILAAARSFGLLGDLDDDLEHYEDGEWKDQLAINYRGGRAACILSMAVALFYGAVTFVFTIRRWFTQEAFDGILSGVLFTASLYSSLFMLLTGIVLEANDLTVSRSRGSGDLRAFRFTFVMAYCLTGIYASLLIYYIWNRLATMNGTSVTHKQTMARHPTHGTSATL